MGVSRSPLLGACVVLCLAALARAEPPGLYELGELTSPSPYFSHFSSQALGVSGDGRVVVGSGKLWLNIPESPWVFVQEAFRSEDGVMTSMAPLVTGHNRSSARAANYDGTWITGVVYRWGSPPDWQGGFLWDWLGATSTWLGDLPGGSTWSNGYAISDDGTVVAGHSSDAITDRAIRWEAGPPATLTPIGNGWEYSYAYGVSGDGTKTVGFQQEPLPSPHGVARCWDGWVMIDLPSPPGDFGTRARGISPDGSTIVGRSRQSSGDVATRWDGCSATANAELLGTALGHLTSEANDASVDGGVIVGWSRVDINHFREAMIWDAEHGMQLLHDVLTDDYGFDLTGWTLREAEGISDDGKVIVGTGINPDSLERGFRVVLGGAAAPACSNGSDDDGDGAIDYPSDPSCQSVLGDSESQCSDGIDNDGDGRVDFDPVTHADAPTYAAGTGDPGCASAAGATESPRCQDGVDNDGQTGTDFDGGASVLGSGSRDPAGRDPQCLEPWRNTERPGCGLGLELAVVVAALLRARGRRRWSGTTPGVDRRPQAADA